mgnify:CR=1 FL=1
MHPLVKWTALTLAICLPLSAQAHRAWMLPSATVLSGKMSSTSASLSTTRSEADKVSGPFTVPNTRRRPVSCAALSRSLCHQLWS